jgi:predicted amidohydrolase YtcJ
LEKEKFSQALLVEGDAICGAGTLEEMTTLAVSLGGAEKIDCRRGLLLPGFHDSHLHLRHFGSRVQEIDLRGVSSIDGLIEKARSDLKRIAPEAGALVHGGGWNQEDFHEISGTVPWANYPMRFDLDRISREHPIILERICGHTLCCNTKALEKAEEAGLGALFSGKGVERDGAGKPLGIFHEKAAFELSRALLPPLDAARARSQIEYGLRQAAASGITSIDSNDIFDDNWDLIRGAYLEVLREGKLRVRVSLQCGLSKKPILDEFSRRGWLSGETLGHPLLKMGALKLFADGTLGSRTAWLERPYSDDPASRGLRAMSGPAMEAAVRDGDERGFQLIIHAIGDAAADETLRCLETVTSPGRNPLRHGLVHCEVMNESLIDRMARNRLTAFLQPAFLTHDIFFAESRLGRERARYFLPFASMLRRGISAGFGTDCPVEPLNPLLGIACAVLRRPAVQEPRLPDSPPAQSFFPEEALDCYAAVDAYTQGSAAVTGEGERLGRIAPGYKADLVLLDRDIFALPPEKIPGAKVLFSMTGGELEFCVSQASLLRP